MPQGFFPLKVSRIIRETPDAVSIAFQVPTHLKNQFGYLAGQYLTFHLVINGEEVRRSYSVCSSPYLDEMPVIAVKKVENGRMSTYFNEQLKEGDIIEAMPPMGKFTVEPAESRKTHYVLIGGGSGITPLYSILLTVLNKEPNSTITLLYANRNTESVIFARDLEKLAAAHAGKLDIVYVYDQPPVGWHGLSGFLTTPMIHQVLRQYVESPREAVYYICGPGPMMQMAKSSLEMAGIPAEHVRTEYFSAVSTEPKAAPPISETEDASIPHDVKVEVYGKEHTITVKPGDTILNAAQDAGLEPPFSCTVGVCTTCRARVLSGKVHMDEREGLSDAEMNEGFVLTCQSHPLTDGVHVIYE